MARPKLLFLCQTLPYPPDGGVWIRTYHVLRLLSRAFDITALCFERAGSSCSLDDWRTAVGPAGLGRFAQVEVFRLPQKDSRVRFIWDHLRSVTVGRVYTNYLYASKPFRTRLTALLNSRRFDLVHVDSLDLAAYLPAFRGIPVVCVHHDIESTLLGRRAALDHHRWRAAYLRLQAGLMAGVERRWCAHIALNVTVSEQDEAVLKRLVPNARVCVVPNGVDLDEFQPVSAEGRGVAFVGGTKPLSEPRCAHLLLPRDPAASGPRRAGSRGSLDRPGVSRAMLDLSRPVRRGAHRLRRGRAQGDGRGSLSHGSPSDRRRHAFEDPERMGDGKTGRHDLGWLRGSRRHRRRQHPDQRRPQGVRCGRCLCPSRCRSPETIRRSRPCNGGATVFSWEAIGNAMIDAYLRLPPEPPG